MSKMKSRNLEYHADCHHTSLLLCSYVLRWYADQGIFPKGEQIALVLQII
jgi:hypothetical protein